MNKRFKGLSIICFALMFTLLASCGKKDEARTIKAEKINGTVTATTEKKTVDVKKGEQLKSGQTISVESGSDLTLLLDADKHVFAEENSVFNLVAKGSSGKTKTKIVMESGKIQYDIDKKLKDKETFEVSTPNATMSVRGTSFIVEIIGKGEDAVTKITVEKGSIEVVTEENGVKKTEILTAGSQKTYDGVFSEFDLGNGGNGENGGGTVKQSRDGYGPQVLAITYDSKGEEVREYFNFFENHPDFTDSKLEKMTLDLQGQVIELQEIWTLNTNISIENGTVKTSNVAYIENKGTLHFGFEYSGNAWTSLDVSGLGIENKGTLHLRSGKYTIENGVGIHNTGELIPEFTDEAKDRFDTSYEPEVSVNAGSFIVNDGTCILDGATITGSNEGLVINNKELFLLNNYFHGNAPGYIVNNDTGRLWISNTILYLEDDAAIGLKNLGSYENYMSFDKYTNVYMSQNYPLVMKVFKGTGVLNQGDVQGTIYAYMDGGVAVDNFGTMYKDTNSYGELDGIMEGGLLVHNEKSGEMFCRVHAYVKSGQVMWNEGTLGTNDSQAYFEFEVKAAADSYTGTLVLNDTAGKMYGNYNIVMTSLDNAKVIDNKGEMSPNNLMIGSGFKLDKLSSWEDWRDSSKEWLLSNFLPRPEYAIEPDVTVKNSIVIYDEGSTDIQSYLNGFICGTGSGKYEFYRPSGTQTHKLGMINLIMYSANATGLSIDSGLPVYGEQIHMYIGKAEEGSRMVPQNEWIYYNRNYEFDRERFTGNIGVYNKGDLKFGKDVAAQAEVYLNGSNSRGIINEGFIEASPYVWTSGHSNTGIDNSGSISGKTLMVAVSEIGGNTGAINSGIIKDMDVSVNSTWNYDFREALYDQKSSSYGKDVGFYNMATGIIDSPRNHLTVYNWTQASTGLISENQIISGYTSFTGLDGTCVYLTKDSTTQSTQLNVDSYVDGYNADKYRSEHTVRGTVLMLEGLYDVSGALSETDSSGSPVTGQIYVNVEGSGSTGIYIATGASLHQIYNGSYYSGASITVRDNAAGIINEGTLHLDYPGFHIRNSSGYTKCLVDRGIFSFTPIPEAKRGGYGEKGCPGPWYGAEYSEINN